MELIISQLEAHAAAIESAYKYGILGIYSDGAIQLKKNLFNQLLSQNDVEFDVILRGNEEFPYEVSFIFNKRKYFAIYSEEEFQDWMERHLKTKGYV